MGITGTIFFYIGISMGWLYLFMGTVLGSAVVPVALCVTWRHANRLGCIWGAIGGFVAGLIAWLVTTSKLNGGVLNATTTGGDYEMLAGNVASIVVGGLISVGVSFWRPEMEFDFAVTRAINSKTTVVHERPEGEAKQAEEDIDEKHGSENEKGDIKELTAPVAQEERKGITTLGDEERESLKKAFKFSVWSSVALFVILIIIVPLPLFFSSVVYNARGFTAWTVIGIIWMFSAFFTVVVYPVYESRSALVMVSKGVIKDIFTKGSGKYVAPNPDAA